MSLSDLWNKINAFSQHIVHGDLSGALGDVGQAVQDTVGGVTDTKQYPTSIGILTGDTKEMGGPGSVVVSPPHVVVAPPRPVSSGAQNCCNRFTFNGGFLVDGVTGRVWQFSAATNSFDEVPVNNNKVKQGLVNSLIENKLSSFKAQYECEQLATVPVAQRAALLAQFEKDHLDPLRAAAQTLTY
jgi:hypothetical protein